MGFDNFHSLLRETMNGFLFWSLMQGLGPMIWFYPLNELELSGYEVFVLFYLTPITVGIPLVLPLIQNKWILGLLKFGILCGVSSFQAPTTLMRLIIMACGSGAAMLVLVASLWSPNQKTRTTSFWGLMLGLMAFISSRIWFTSFVPTWWTNQSNSVVLGLGAITLVDHFISGVDNSDDTSSQIKKYEKPCCLFTSMGFGSLLYLTQMCFGEVSLLSRWVVTGYPDHGPQPYTSGPLVLLALSFGVYMSACRFMATSKVWWLLGTLSFGVLYYLPTYQGFAGGLVLAVYTMSVWPEMIDRLTLCPPARSLVIAILTYLVQIFFSVWTTAFNFVPGGVYTREHSDYLIFSIVTCLFLGLFIGAQKKESGPTALVTVDKTKMPSSSVNLLLVLITIAGLCGFAARYDRQHNIHPAKTHPKEFSAAIWTYHFGYDNRGWPSLERSASLLNDTGADFITLLESDASKPYLGNNDLGMWLGEKLGMYVDFGPSTRDHTWGNLILSKYPIVRSTHHLMPSPHGEVAPGITATVNYTGTLVDFVVAHMGNDVDPLDRKQQANFLASELHKSENPVVFLSYVTSKPFSAEYNQIIKKGRVKDIDDTDLKRWCEYIMYRGLIRLGYARLSHGGLSDTEIQVGKFQIPEDPENYKDNKKVTIKPENVDKRLHFNSRFGSFFGSHGYFSDNRFHMSTPKYFLP
ncbi:hypothetical protein ScPMuIL_011619 [Solemya velum]